MTKLTLVLARGPGKPDGDLLDRLTLRLQLTADGHIDGQAYDAASHPWLGVRERNGGSRELEVIRIDEGWALQSTDSEDDPIWTFNANVFRPGEVVALWQPNGDEYLFRIVAAEAE